IAATAEGSEQSERTSIQLRGSQVSNTSIMTFDLPNETPKKSASVAGGAGWRSAAGHAAKARPYRLCLCLQARPRRHCLETEGTLRIVPAARPIGRPQRARSAPVTV